VPRVTVITATYNWAPVLPYAIGSILDQTFTDFELLVIGDGCTDESEDVVGAIADPRVHWHNLPANTGHQAGPNNEGLARATGELIAYLGHDDVWLPNHLRLLVRACDAGARLAHATMLRVLPNHPPYPWPFDGWEYTPGVWIPPTSVMHTRELIETVGDWRTPFETGTVEPEADLLARMAADGAAPFWVRRLTSVKLPAAQRPGVYRERPNHEQAYWLERIRSARHPEQSALAACDEPVPPPRRRRWWRRPPPRPQLPPQPHLGPLPATAEARWRARRRFKGLED
jgi:glycosyltransferase involved in cell wall biosynthesis